MSIAVFLPTSGTAKGRFVGTVVVIQGVAITCEGIFVHTDTLGTGRNLSKDIFSLPNAVDGLPEVTGTSLWRCEVRKLISDDSDT
jgi:hypothetical protein